MKNYSLLFLLIAVFISLNSCSEKKTSLINLDNCPIVAEKSGDLTTLNYASVKDTISIYLDDFWGRCEIIPLENESEEALIKTDGHSVVSGQYMGFYSTIAGGYKLFDKKGQYISTLSSRGNAPNQYRISIYDSFIDETSNRVYLLPMMSDRILVYDLKGNEFPVIPLAYRVGKGRLKPNTDTKDISIGVFPFADSPSVFWTQDEAGNILHEVSSDRWIVTPTDYSNEVDINLNTSNFDLSFFHWSPRTDSLYHYNIRENRLDPVLTIEFKDDNILQHEYIELSEQFIIRLYNSKSIESSMIMIDKKTLRGAYVKFKLRGLGGIEIPSSDLNFKNGFYWANLYPFELQKTVERVLSSREAEEPEVKERLLKLLDYLDGDNNNIIFTGQLRKEDLQRDSDIIIVDLPKATSKKATPTVLSEEVSDDKLYLFADLLAHKIKRMPQLNHAKEYFRENNLYKDWNPQDKKEVHVSYIVEKNGTTTNVSVAKSCGIEKLDKEAIRLIQEVRFVSGLNMKDEPIRCGDGVIAVYFPPLPN